MTRKQAKSRIGKDDLIVFEGVQLRLFEMDGDVTILHRLDFPDVKKRLDRDELAKMWDSTKFSFYPNHFAVGGHSPTIVPGPTLATLRPMAKAFTLRKVAYVEEFIKLLAKGEYKRTYHSARDAAKEIQPIVDGLGKGVPEELKTITSEHTPPTRKARSGTEKRIVVNGEILHPGKNEPGGETLMRDLWKYERSLGDPMSLRPKYENCGYFGSHLASEVEAIVTKNMVRWLDTKRLTPTDVLEYVKIDIDEYNANIDVEAGDKKLAYPKVDAIQHVIDGIDPYYASVMRDGEKIANLKFAWLQDPIDIRVPGQRVEIDAYRIDLVTLFTWSGAWEGLNRNQRRVLKKSKMWVTIAIDKATRCILAMRLSPGVDAPNAVATLAMIESDKTIYSDAAGTETPWYMRTGTMIIVADGGYVMDEVRTAMAMARGTIEYPEAGDPTMRATIERIFRTVATKLIAKLDGKTFGDIFRRADYDSEGHAGLTEDELAWILVTWVVDIYHNTPHEGLKGKTPRQAWDDAVAIYDVRPWRDAHGRRSAFGVRLKNRSLTSKGFEFLGNYYRDMNPQGAMNRRLHSKNKKFEILVDVTNLGAISFIDGEVAIAVPCADPTMEGVHAARWIETTQAVKAENAHRSELPREIAHRALSRILKVNEQAGRRATIADPAYSAADLENFERIHFKSFRYAEPTVAERSELIGEIVTPVDVADISSLFASLPDQTFPEIEQDVAAAADGESVAVWPTEPPRAPALPQEPPAKSKPRSKPVKPKLPASKPPKSSPTAPVAPPKKYTLED